MPNLIGYEQRVVGIADFAVSNGRQVILATHSLGSCLGIAIYDPVAQVGGLLHIMLPDSNLDPIKAAARPAMFLDTGLPAMYRAAYQLGADKHRLKIYVAGGAQVMDGSGFFSIGKRNYEALLEICRHHGLRLQAEQVGGLVSRSVYLQIETGDLWMKASGTAGETFLCKNSMIT
jgi:chemotaxis protein CheD